MNLPPLADLICADGDERITADASGRNRYGRTALPSDDLAFGSSTASSISQDAWDAVQTRYQQWQADERPSQTIWSEGVDTIRERFAALYGLTDTAMIVAPSGTDAHLLAVLLLAGPHAAPLMSLSVETKETGSGVPYALAGQRFNAQGGRLGDVLSYGDRAETCHIPARAPDGHLRPTADVAAELDAHIEACAHVDRRTLLVVTDVSKTGLIAPDPQTVLDLKARWGPRLDVLIDACQLRLSPATLRAWLAQGFMVAVTGSKFAAGPAFSGLLLLPDNMTRRLKHRTLPAQLPELGDAALWPADFAARRACAGRPAFGVLARWEAALFEMEAFFAIDDAQLLAITQALSDVFKARLAASPLLQLVAAPSLSRAGLGIDDGWDKVTTILPFIPPIDAARLYTRMSEEGFQVGQPVGIGGEQALRLCLSMPLIARAAKNEASLQDVMRQGESVIKAAEHLCKTDVTGLAGSRAAG